MILNWQNSALTAGWTPPGRDQAATHEARAERAEAVSFAWAGLARARGRIIAATTDHERSAAQDDERHALSVLRELGVKDETATAPPETCDLGCTDTDLVKCGAARRCGDCECVCHSEGN